MRAAVVGVARALLAPVRQVRRGALWGHEECVARQRYQLPRRSQCESPPPPTAPPPSRCQRRPRMGTASAWRRRWLPFARRCGR